MFIIPNSGFFLELCVMDYGKEILRLDYYLLNVFQNNCIRSVLFIVGNGILYVLKRHT